MSRKNGGGSDAPRSREARCHKSLIVLGETAIWALLEYHSFIFSSLCSSSSYDLFRLSVSRYVYLMQRQSLLFFLAFFFNQNVITNLAKNKKSCKSFIIRKRNTCVFFVIILTITLYLKFYLFDVIRIIASHCQFTSQYYDASNYSGENDSKQRATSCQIPSLFLTHDSLLPLQYHSRSFHSKKMFKKKIA